jgi:hypothetical protein
MVQVQGGNMEKIVISPKILKKSKETFDKIKEEYGLSQSGLIDLFMTSIVQGQIQVQDLVQGTSTSIVQVQSTSIDTSIVASIVQEQVSPYAKILEQVQVQVQALEKQLKNLTSTSTSTSTSKPTKPKKEKPMSDAEAFRLAMLEVEAEKEQFRKERQAKKEAEEKQSELSAWEKFQKQREEELNNKSDERYYYPLYKTHHTEPIAEESNPDYDDYEEFDVSNGSAVWSIPRGGLKHFDKNGNLVPCRYTDAQGNVHEPTAIEKQQMEKVFGRPVTIEGVDF